MGLPSVHIQLVTVIGGNIRIITGKDMDHFTGQVETDSRGNSSRVSGTGMEYADGQVEQYIMGDSNRVIAMVMAIIGIQMEMNTTESTRMMHYGERES
jgi:acylphosphatase